jgi:hypothetical protein
LVNRPPVCQITCAELLVFNIYDSFFSAKEQLQQRKPKRKKLAKEAAAAEKEVNKVVTTLRRKIKLI